MKKLLIILGIAMLSTICYGQDRTYPVKKDNVIIIQTENSDSFNFMDFGKFLIKNGYTFGQKDKDFLFLITNPKEIPGFLYDGYYRLIISFEDTTIVIKAEMLTLGIDATVFGTPATPTERWDEWYYIKAKDSYYKRVFNCFYPILEAYVKETNNKNIVYRKQ